MAGNFEIIQNNFVRYFEPEKCSVVKFRPWIQFLNEHLIVKDSLTLNAPLKTDLLRLVYTTSVISNDVVTFTIRDRQYRIDESVVRAALNFLTENLVNLPSNQELVTFLSNINHQGPLDLTKLSKSSLVDEWSCFFDTLIKVFANCTKTSYFKHLIFITLHWLRCGK